MLYTILTREDALALLNFGKQLHQESRFKDTTYNQEAIWKLFGLTLEQPTKFFICYSKDKSNLLNGFFIGQIAYEYFTGDLIAKDLGMYVVPELRGSPIFYKMLKAFEQWSKDNQATKIVLYHSTGINPEKSKEMFPKLGYSHFGYMFDKEIK